MRNVWNGHVTVIPALDYIRGAKTVPEYLAGYGPTDMAELEREMHWIWSACSLIRDTLEANGGYREGPYIGFNALEDEPFIFFKCQNNGNTVVISQRPMGFAEVYESFPLQFGSAEAYKRVIG